MSLKPIVFHAISAGGLVNNAHVTREALCRVLRHHRAKRNKVTRGPIPHSYRIDGLVTVFVTPRIIGLVLGGAQ